MGSRHWGRSKGFGCLLALLSCFAAHAGTVRYVYSDPQGTPLAEADAQGNITARFDYAPYGNVAMGTAPNGPGYTGHVNDPDTGLVYMQARYYDPVMARFLSVDPVKPSAGNTFNFNRYTYVNNNPVNHIDPDGRNIQIAGDAAFTQTAKGYIAAISQGSGGRVLMEKLQSTPNIIYVVPRAAGLGNRTQGDALGISANGKGTGSTVYLDVTSTTGGQDATGNTSRPGFVGAAHEFGHARAIDQGVQSYDKGNKTPGTTPPSEVHAMANENMVRQEHNIPIRPSYYDPAPKTPPPPPQPIH